MTRARKPNVLKIASGTNQPCRMVDEVDYDLVDDVPPAPDWLSNGHAVKEWERLAPILHKSRLLTVAGCSAFGVMCSLHGKIVQLFAAGECPNGNMLGQYRSLVNDFGLTPVAQGKVRPSGQKEKTNSFAGNGRKQTA